MKKSILVIIIILAGCSIYEANPYGELNLTLPDVNYEKYMTASVNPDNLEMTLNFSERPQVLSGDIFVYSDKTRYVKLFQIGVAISSEIESIEYLNDLKYWKLHFKNKDFLESITYMKIYNFKTTDGLYFPPYENTAETTVTNPIIFMYTNSGDLYVNFSMPVINPGTLNVRAQSGGTIYSYDLTMVNNHVWKKTSFNMSSYAYPIYLVNFYSLNNAKFENKPLSVIYNLSTVSKINNFKVDLKVMEYWTNSVIYSPVQLADTNFLDNTASKSRDIRIIFMPVNTLFIDLFIDNNYVKTYTNTGSSITDTFCAKFAEPHTYLITLKSHNILVTNIYNTNFSGDYRYDYFFLTSKTTNKITGYIYGKYPEVYGFENDITSKKNLKNNLLVSNLGLSSYSKMTTYFYVLTNSATAGALPKNIYFEYNDQWVFIVSNDVNIGTLLIR
ncbi:MAG: hypothetical protein HPY53_01240 [Brevinematales bacterium]|nr:hypothetical protein [Brevinematales bacterium]